MHHNYMIQETARVTGQLRPLPTLPIVNSVHLYQLRPLCVPTWPIVFINIINDGKHELQVAKHVYYFINIDDFNP
ncbi:hypothetical protein E2C01_090148 [Portunus trituberculatus]|uniref:Uncharacterized protein n=1 Tax=Portunus trituberculatus TaxID=210409 RepID=A0A5B7JL29_PORTR|nr:hypothetical protein [Portunus trituberculatus]